MFHQSNFITNPRPQPPPAAAMPSRPPLDMSAIAPLLQEAAIEYDSFLSDLTWNSKQVINQLTTIAGENIPAADAICAVIEQRVYNALPNMKLPFLYLMDSIVKNIGRRYLSRFAENLFHTFTNAYGLVPLAVRMSLRRMLSTWPDIYGFELVNAMTARADHLDSIPFAQSHHHVPLRIHPQQSPYYQQRSAPPMPPPTAHMPPQGAPPQPVSMLRSQPIHPSQPSVSHIPISAPQPLSLQSALHAVAPRAAPMPPMSPQFVQLENMMSQVTRNASMGVLPSNHELFNLNRMISAQLQSSPLPLQRDALLRFQHQLRNISSTPRRQNLSNPHSVPPSAPRSITLPLNPRVQPTNVNAVLSNMLRAMPPGLLDTVQSVAPSSQNIRVASVLDPPSPAVHNRSDVAQHRMQHAHRPSFPAIPTPSVLTFSDLKTLSHHAGVRSLYTDLPHLSKSDGMRFATKESLREHLDWLFRQNRRKRGTKEQVVVGGQSRGWFDILDVFLGKVDPNAKPTNPSVNKKNVVDDTDDKNVSVVESKTDNDLCTACCEAFETFWDDDHHAWMLRDATSTEDGELYHVKCMQYTALDDGDESDDCSAQEEHQGNDKPSQSFGATSTPSQPPSDAKTESKPINNAAAEESVANSQSIMAKAIKAEATPAVTVSREAEPQEQSPSARSNGIGAESDAAVDGVKTESMSANSGTTVICGSANEATKLSKEASPEVKTENTDSSAGAGQAEAVKTLPVVSEDLAKAELKDEAAVAKAALQTKPVDIRQTPKGAKASDDTENNGEKCEKSSAKSSPSSGQKRKRSDVENERRQSIDDAEANMIDMSMAGIERSREPGCKRRKESECQS